MTPCRVTPFPWPRLPRVERAALVARREVVLGLESALDPSRLGPALRDLLGDDAELSDGRLVQCELAEGLPFAPAECVALSFPALGIGLWVRPEVELTRAAVARLLDQDFQLGWADTGLDAALRGAGAALALEVARRAARGEAPELCSSASGAAGASPLTLAAGSWLLRGSATLRLAGKPYRLELCAAELAHREPALRRPARTQLGRLGSVRLRVPWVCAVSSISLGTLQALSIGDVWLPGVDAWLGGEPALSAGLLVPPRSERGFPVRVSSGRTVLGAEVAEVPEEWEASMSEEESDLEQVVGETPVLVRLELGALEMSAAEWAALRPGDVLATGRRLDEVVTLRTGGREIARGELVEIEGELGVRITQVGLAKVQP
jgi:type III secretion system YscQ/HrcQ family protein